MSKVAYNCPHCGTAIAIPSDARLAGQNLTCPVCRRLFSVPAPTAFDPYYEWLGIAPSEQPPNHYRLLGIQLYEANAAVIDNAADRQMRHVRSFQVGTRAADSQRLLMEIANARVCLLSPAKKSLYDRSLADVFRSTQPELLRKVPPPAAAANSVVQPRIGNGGTTSASRHRRPLVGHSSIQLIMAVLGGIVGLSLGALIVFHIRNRTAVGAGHREQIANSAPAAKVKRPPQPSSRESRSDKGWPEQARKQASPQRNAESPLNRGAGTANSRDEAKLPIIPSPPTAGAFSSNAENSHESLSPSPAISSPLPASAGDDSQSKKAPSPTEDKPSAPLITAREREIRRHIELLANGVTPEERAGAADWLSSANELEAPEVVLALTKALKDVAPLVAFRASLALGKIGEPAKPALPALAKYLASRTDPTTDRKAIFAAMIHVDSKSREVRSILTTLLVAGTGTKPRVSNDLRYVGENREYACQVIASLGGDADWSVPLLRELLELSADEIAASSSFSSDSFKVYKASIEALVSIGKKDTGVIAALRKYRRLKHSTPATLADTALRRLESDEPD